MDDKDLRDILFNLESIIIGYLGEDQQINQEAVADLLRKHGQSPLVHMALIAALTHPEADYRLVVVENTKKYPGGVAKLQASIAQISRAHAVREYVDTHEYRGSGTEAAVAAASAHFALSRSSIFKLVRKSRQLIPSLSGVVH